jgi:hypothetical protein
MVDHLYQREEVSESNTLSIASEWSFSLCGALVVMERTDGTLWIVDGQQRFLAARRRGDIAELPCIVFQSAGLESEALAFVGVNTSRKAVPARAKWAARLMAGKYPEVEIATWLEAHGLRVTADGKCANGVDFPRTLVDLWKLDSLASMGALLTGRAVVSPEPLHSVVHRGLWYLIHSGVQVQNYEEKLRRAGGLTEILRASKAMALELNLAVSPKVAGLAILGIINRGKRSGKLAL